MIHQKQKNHWKVTDEEKKILNSAAVECIKALTICNLSSWSCGSSFVSIFDPRSYIVAFFSRCSTRSCESMPKIGSMSDEFRSGTPMNDLQESKTPVSGIGYSVFRDSNVPRGHFFWTAVWSRRFIVSFFWTFAVLLIFSIGSRSGWVLWSGTCQSGF